MRAGKRLPVAHHAMIYPCCERVVRPCIAPLPHSTPAPRCAPCKRWYQTLTSASWLPSPLRQGGGARFGQALVSGERLHHAQVPWHATRTLRATRNRERAFSGSERKFPEPAARPAGAPLRCAAKLRSCIFDSMHFLKLKSTVGIRVCGRGNGGRSLPLQRPKTRDRLGSRLAAR